MFDSIVQKLQSFSPLTSPTTSPTVSPRPTKKKFGFGRSNRKRRVGGYAKEDIREVQSEPELDYENEKKRSAGFFGMGGADRRKKISAPAATGSHSKASSRGFSVVPGSILPHGPVSLSPSVGIYDCPPSLKNYPAMSRANGYDNGGIYEDVRKLKAPHISLRKVFTASTEQINSTKLDDEIYAHIPKVRIPEGKGSSSLSFHPRVRPSPNGRPMSVYDTLRNNAAFHQSRNQPAQSLGFQDQDRRPQTGRLQERTKTTHTEKTKTTHNYGRSSQDHGRIMPKVQQSTGFGFQTVETSRLTPVDVRMQAQLAYLSGAGNTKSNNALMLGSGNSKSNNALLLGSGNSKSNNALFLGSGNNKSNTGLMLGYDNTNTKNSKSNSGFLSGSVNSKSNSGFLSSSKSNTSLASNMFSSNMHSRRNSVAQLLPMTDKSNKLLPMTDKSSNKTKILAGPRKSSYDPPKRQIPEFSRTVSSDSPRLSMVPHEEVDEIYDVPANVARKVKGGARASKRGRAPHGTPHISRTVGRMEGFRQVIML